jgi:hypothetical protein
MSDPSVHKIVEDEIEEEDEEDEDDLMMDNPLMDLLVTSDGVNIADAVDRVAKHLDAQNKIFIKLYTLLNQSLKNCNAK